MPQWHLPLAGTESASANRRNLHQRSAAPSQWWKADSSPCWTSGSNREVAIDDVHIRPGQTTLADWCANYRGAGVTLDPGCHDAIARSATAVEAILARGEPIYGINTGFGRLASIRIAPHELATLQRNIVLSHAAGVGDPMPPQLVRLMLALKLSALA